MSMNSATALFLEQFDIPAIDEKWFRKCFDFWEGKEPSWEDKEDCISFIAEHLSDEVGGDFASVLEGLENDILIDSTGTEAHALIESAFSDIDFQVIAERIVDRAAVHMARNKVRGVESCTDVFNDFYYGKR